MVLTTHINGYISLSGSERWEILNAPGGQVLVVCRMAAIPVMHHLTILIDYTLKRNRKNGIGRTA